MYSDDKNQIQKKSTILLHHKKKCIMPFCMSFAVVSINLQNIQAQLYLCYNKYKHQ